MAAAASTPFTDSRMMCTNFHHLTGHYQLLRAGTGVAANHRAAGYSRSKREFVARLSVVVEEADESELWLDLLDTLEFGPLVEVRRPRGEAGELRAIFSASRSTAAGKRKRWRAPDNPLTS